MSHGTGKVRTDRRRATGRTGESAAAALLESKGFRIVARNWRCRSGELDIVAELPGMLVIVEVRTRRTTGTKGTAKESVDERKQRQVRETAHVYLYQNKMLESKLRFDVVAVELCEGETISLIEHIENAF